MHEHSYRSLSKNVLEVTDLNDVLEETVNYTIDSIFDVLANDTGNGTIVVDGAASVNNWWALIAIMLVVCTAAGNVLVCLAIYLERRLQNVTNYFLMSLAITDLLVAILVMPLGILTLLRGYFPLPAIYCLCWLCLDVLLCTASIMHLCTISVDRYLSLRYPMRFGRNKTRKRVTVKIAFVWILSSAMSLPLVLKYSKKYYFVSDKSGDRDRTKKRTLRRRHYEPHIIRRAGEERSEGGGHLSCSGAYWSHRRSSPQGE